jgi:hypothetical protein
MVLPPDRGSRATHLQVGAHTSDFVLAAALLVTGIGIGATMTPSMAAAFGALSRAETPRATSALNASQRIAGAIGTVLFAIILQHSITANVPHHQGGIQALAALPPAQQAYAAPPLAAAFGTTFWVAAGLIAAAFVPALLLPRPTAPAAAPIGGGRRTRGEKYDDHTPQR